MSVALDPESSHAHLPNNRLYKPFSHNDLRAPQDLHGNTLKFLDVSPSDSSLLQCPPSISSSWSASSLADSTHSSAAKLSTSPASGTSSWSRSSSRDRDTPTPVAAISNPQISAQLDQNPTHLAAPAAPPPDQAPAVRKTSPGLAARLKALGFGPSKRNSPEPPTPLQENVGRLDTRQLRQLDEKHIAGSLSSVISRRGRPWRGATASPALKSSASQPNLRAAHVHEKTPQLPEIESPEPLPMDTQKYRLPDHTNGNGTKATLATRNEHLARQIATEQAQSRSSEPPIPPPKDSPVAETTPLATAQVSDEYVPGLSSYFTPGHNRPGSIYTLSRASFANQLAQLTSLQLPDAESLSSKVSAIPTASAATKALINAAEQLRSWISKAHEVIGGLDSEDDVEWAAAAGREGLDDVETAISRFEELINAYVSAIERLQQREDIPQVPTADLERAVVQMEIIVNEWSNIRKSLHNVRVQVEIAMEWEELWNTVLGDIQSEMDELSRLVFEMEERRHKNLTVGDNADFDLDAIGDDSPAFAYARANRLSMPIVPTTPSGASSSGLSADDSSLLALFARMQPLRASLDFLPMRLSVFEARAEKMFPTACEELEMRRTGLDGSYKKLENDAESLRKELGEDRWVVVFRGAGRQAQKMQESVERSLAKLKEAVDANAHVTNPPVMAKKVESYEAKKMHYGPAIERVLSIIDRGVKDRLTVNGEILRLHNDIQSRWSNLKEQMSQVDAVVEDLLAEGKSTQLRESVSSLLSADKSTLGSGRDTPSSSPPSSVIMTSLGFDPHTPTLAPSNKTSRRHSSIPAPASSFAKRFARLSTIPSSSASTPVPPSNTHRPPSTLDYRPRWNGSTNTNDLHVDFPYDPPVMPSPHGTSRRTPTTQRSVSAVTPASSSKPPTIRAPRATSESPMVDGTPSRRSNSRLAIRDRLGSPGQSVQHPSPCVLCFPN